MTYLTTPRGAIKRYGKTARRPPALGGFFDDFSNAMLTISIPNYQGTKQYLMMVRDDAANADTLKCITDANAAPKIKQVDDYVDMIAKTWNPTGFYTPKEIGSAAGTVVGNLIATLAFVQASPNPYEVPSRDSDVAIQVGELQQWIDKGQPFLLAAQSGTNVVNAPGFKRWVIASLQQMSAAMVVRSVLECSLDIIDTLSSMVDAVWSAIKFIGNLIVKAGETITEIPDFLSTVTKVVKWGAIIGGGAWLALKLREAARGRR